MAAMIFPPAPSDGQQITQPNGITYTYSAVKARWDAKIGDAGGMVPIESGTLVNVPEADILLPQTLYPSFVVKLHAFRPVTDDSILRVRSSSDGGTTFDNGAGDYQHTRNGATTNASYFGGSVSDNRIEIAPSLSDTSFWSLAGEINIEGASLAEYTNFYGSVSYRNSTGLSATQEFSGQRFQTLIVDAIRISMNTGNIALMDYTLYGLKAA